MKYNYAVLHIPEQIRKMLVKQDALIAHKSLLDQRKNARISLKSSRVLSTKDWRFVPAQPKVDWNSFSLTALKQFHIKLGQGAFICDPVTFMLHYPDQIMYWLYKESKTKRKQNSTEAGLVRSFWNRGILLVIPDNVVILEKIELGGFLAAFGIMLEDITIIVGKNSSAQVSCQRDLFGKGVRYTMRSLTALLGDHSSLTLLSDEKISTGSFYITESYYELQRNAQLNFLFVQTGGGLNKQRHEVVLAGSGAQADICGVSGVGKFGYHDIVTYQTHSAAHTKSSVRIKSLAGGKGRTAYQGLIHLNKDATGAHALQDHRAILLNKNARSWSVPSLEVLTSDVVCEHASATGQLEDEQITYLRSRGIALERARELLLNAFLQEAFDGSSLKVHKKDIVSRVIKSARMDVTRKT